MKKNKKYKLMDWDKFLLKRAKEQLSEYKNFELKNVERHHVVIKNKEGKLSLTHKLQKDHFAQPRIQFVQSLFNKINTKDLPDFSIKLNNFDSYDYDDTLSFCWARPYNKPGLLMPCWSFNKWEETIATFDKEYIPWESRLDEPYFRGADSSKDRSNIRKIVHNIYPKNVILNNPIRKPETEAMKYKLCFDLPGAKPWSVRSPYIDLSGSASVRIIHYYPKWDEKPWIQFYEDPKEMRGIFIEGNYDRPLKQEQIHYLEDELPRYIKLSLGKRSQTRAEKIREKMKQLTTQHMVNYVSYICNYIGERQD